MKKNYLFSVLGILVFLSLLSQMPIRWLIGMIHEEANTGGSTATTNNGELALEIKMLKSELESFGLEINECREEALRANKHASSLAENNLSLMRQINELKAKESVTFNCKQSVGQGWSAMQTHFGIFFVSIKNIQQYLDGFKIIFSLGNPSLVKFTDLSIKLTWTYAMPVTYSDLISRSLSNDELEKLTKWDSSSKTKQFNLSKEILAGSWTDIELFVNPAKLEELEYLEFVITNLKVTLVPK